MTPKEALTKLTMLFSKEMAAQQAKLEDGTIISWEGELKEGTAIMVIDEEGNMLMVLKGLSVLLVAMGVGSWLGGVMKSADLTLPGYVGAMLLGALIRNIDDQTKWLQIPHELTERIGVVCLSLFLSVALMNLKLWELTSIAAPLLVNLIIQVIAVQ